MHLSKSPSPNPFVRDAHKGGRCNQSPGASVPLIFEVEGSFKVPYQANPTSLSGCHFGNHLDGAGRGFVGSLGSLCFVQEPAGSVDLVAIQEHHPQPLSLPPWTVLPLSSGFCELRAWQRGAETGSPCFIQHQSRTSNLI